MPQIYLKLWARLFKARFNSTNPGLKLGFHITVNAAGAAADRAAAVAVPAVVLS